MRAGSGYDKRKQIFFDIPITHKPSPRGAGGAAIAMTDEMAIAPDLSPF